MNNVFNHSSTSASPGKSPFDIGFCYVESMGEPFAAAKKLRSLGFDGIELWPDPLARFGVEQWAAAIREGGLRCVQLCPYFNFVHGEALIEKSRALLEVNLHAATQLNCTRLRVFTGPPWGTGVVGAREASEAQWNAAIASLQTFCDVAAEHGIELCLECHDGSLMEDSPSALRLLDAVNRKNLTTNLQIPLVNESWQTSVAALARYTSHIHIHNWLGKIGASPLTFIGQGTFDWLPVIRSVLEQNKGSLCLSVEHVDHGGRDDPWVTAERDGAFLNEMRKKFT